MRLLLLGATGRTGRRVLRRLEARGDTVTTYGRRPGGGARDLVGPLDDPERLAQALEGVGAAICCLASGNRAPVCSTAARLLAGSAPAGLRVVTVSGASVAAPEDRRGPGARAAGAVMALFMGGMLTDRRAELAILRGSRLAWTALRPPRLTERPGRGSWRFDLDHPRGAALARDDLAGAVVEALERDDLIGRAPFVSAGP